MTYMGSRRLRIAAGGALFVGALIAVPSLASRSINPVLAVIGAVPPAVLTGFFVYVAAPRPTRPFSESPRRARVITIVSGIGAALSVLLLAACVQGMFVYADELKRKDPTAGGQLGAVILVFGLAVVFSSWLILRSVPIRARWPTAIVLSVLIGGAWVVGLALNSS